MNILMHCCRIGIINNQGRNLMENNNEKLSERGFSISIKLRYESLCNAEMKITIETCYIFRSLTLFIETDANARHMSLNIGL